jgi:uncharacterized protein (TIRG00374 family)
MNMRRIMIFLGIAGIFFIVVTSLGDPHKILDAFIKVRWYVVPLVIVAQIIDYYCNAKYYQAFFAISKHHVKLRLLYEASLAINFANVAIPSGGVAGTTYLAEAIKSSGVPAAKSTLAQIGRYIFTFVSYFMVLAFGFIVLFFSGNLNKVSVRFVILIMVVILAAGLVLMAVFSERSRFEAFITPLIRFINRFGKTILRRDKPLVNRDSVSTFLTEFYEDYHELLTHKASWPSLLWWSLGGNLAEVATVYVVFLGFGQVVNPGVVITGYTLAIIASVGGILVNGLGVYEAGMIGTFAALGIPFALAFAVVIVYRILNMGLFLPIGLVYYRKHLKEAR